MELLQGVALLEEMSPWRQSLRSQKLKQGLVFHSHFLVPTDPGIQLSGPAPAPYLPAHCYASCHDDNRLNL